MVRFKCHIARAAFALGTIICLYSKCIILIILATIDEDDIEFSRFIIQFYDFMSKKDGPILYGPPAHFSR